MTVINKRKTILNSIFRKTTGQIRLGLDRISNAAGSLGNPQKKYDCVHVAGTNGKGSVCAYIESMLRNSGKKTGLYTSPHIIDFEERFRVNGRPVNPEEWIDIYKELEKTINENKLTFFEISTLIAFEIFRRNGVEWAVFETGLGGRLDATNIIQPAVSVITKISFDHSQYLGETLPKIAGEKFGIIKEKTPVIMMQAQNKEINEAAKRICETKKCEIEFVSKTDINCTQEPDLVKYKGKHIQIPLHGKHQKLNAVCALKAFEKTSTGSLDNAARGIEKTKLSARFQIAEAENKTFVFDAAHNPDSSGRLCDTLKEVFGKKDICFIAGIMKDKDYFSMIDLYAKSCSMIIAASPDTERALDAADICDALPGFFNGKKYTSSSVADAVNRAVQSEYNIICVTGSFFTVGEAMKHLNIKI